MTTTAGAATWTACRRVDAPAAPGVTCAPGVAGRLATSSHPGQGRSAPALPPPPPRGPAGRWRRGSSRRPAGSCPPCWPPGGGWASTGPWPERRICDPWPTNRAGRIGVALPAIQPCRRLVYRPWRSGMALLPDDCGIPSPPRQLEEAKRCLPRGWPCCWCPPWRWMPPACGWGPVGASMTGCGRTRPGGPCQPSPCCPRPVWCARLPRDPWDVPFDGWLDETGLHRTGNL